MNNYGLTKDDEAENNNAMNAMHAMHTMNEGGSKDGGENSGFPSTLLFCEELIIIVERECPGVRALLNNGHANSHSFPPVHGNSLLQMFMMGTEDIPAKTCLALYTALDVAAGTSFSKHIDLDTHVEQVAADFAYTIGVDDTMRDAVLALWHIDNHHNVFRATELLLGDHVTNNLEPGWVYKIARALSDGWPSGTEALHYIRSLELMPSTIDQCALLVRIHLQCNAWEEAFQLQRSLCTLFEEQGYTSVIVMQLRKILITQCCEYLLHTKEDGGDSLLRLPVNVLEEEELMNFYVRKAFGHGRLHVTHMGILLAHLLYHSNVVKAKCIEVISHKMRRDESDEDFETKRTSLQLIMNRFQTLSPIASKIRQNKIVQAITSKYEHVAHHSDVMSALNDLIDPTHLIHQSTGMGAEEREVQEELGKEEQEEDVTMNNAPDPMSAFQPSVAPLGSGGGGRMDGYSGLGTPTKSLIQMAASSDVDAFKQMYSPSMLSPVVQGRF